MLVYHDAQSVRLPEPLTPLEAWNRIVADPLPGLGLAFWLREAVSAWFGVKRIGGFSGRARDRVAPATGWISSLRWNRWTPRFWCCRRVTGIWT